MELRISPDDEVSCHCVSQMSKNLGGSIQTEGKYSKLVYLVFEGKTKVLPAVWMSQYMKVCILQMNA